MKSQLYKFFSLIRNPKLLDRYVFFEFLRIFLGTLVMLIGILLISLLMDNMKNFVNSEAGQSHSVLFVLYNIPQLTVTVSSPALMFAVCFVIGQFSVNKELVSMMSAGLSFYRIITPLVMFGFVIWFLALIISETIVRPFNSAAENEMSYILKGMGVVKDLVYQYHIKGKSGFYYIYLYDEKDKKIKGGFNYIHMKKNGLPDFTVSGNNATYNEQDKSWLIEQVEEIRFDEELKIAEYNKYFEKKYSFNESVEYFLKPSKNVNEMNFFELGDEIGTRMSKGIPYYDLLVERHSIVAMPIMNIIVVIIGAIAGSFTKRSAGVASLGITIVIVLLYYIIFSAGKSLGETGVIPAGLAVWFTPGLFLGVTFWLYKRFNL